MSALLEAARSVWPFKSAGYDPIDMGIEEGVVWALAPGGVFGVNGYALIPAEGHPWSNGIPHNTHPEYDYERYATEDLKVHGGITYGESEGPWIGFDTAHLGDSWGAEHDPMGMCTRVRSMSPDSYARHWTVDMVREEARSLARQLAAMAADDCCEACGAATWDRHFDECPEHPDNEERP